MSGLRIAPAAGDWHGSLSVAFGARFVDTFAFAPLFWAVHAHVTGNAARSLRLLPLRQRAISHPRLTVPSQQRGLSFGGFGHTFRVTRASRKECLSCLIASPSSPAASARSDVPGAGGQQDEVAREIYRPGVSDR
jgi:hypothetical protein